MGHYHRIAAELAIYKRRFNTASRHAQIALKITLPNDVYFNGVMEALQLLVKSTSTL